MSAFRVWQPHCAVRHKAVGSQTDGKATAIRLTAPVLWSAIPRPLSQSPSDRIGAEASFPQRSGTNAETRPLIALPSFT